MKKLRYVLLLLSALAAGAILFLCLRTDGAVFTALSRRTAAPTLFAPTPAPSVDSQAVGQVEKFRRQRETKTAEDRESLEKLIGAENVSQEIRDGAARQLETMIANRQQEQALTGALLGAGYADCLVVAENDAVTVLLKNNTITDTENAMILTLCLTYTAVRAENVRIIAEGAQ